MISVAESSTSSTSLFGSKIKEEPIDPSFDDEEDCLSDDFGDGYGDTYGDGDGYDEDDTFCHSMFLRQFDYWCRLIMR